MSSVTASFCLIVCFLVGSSEDLENITAELGQDVTLTCKAADSKPITVVEWNRHGLDSEEYVFLYRDGNFLPSNQHPSYKNRVDLKDRKMKDGDVSLILKNVTRNDTGRYECYVVQGEINSKSIYLEVLPPGDKDGGDKDGGDKDGGDKDGGDKDGGDKDGNTEKRIEDGGDKDGGDKVGGDKVGGGMVGIIVGSVVGALILLAAVALVGRLMYKRLICQNLNLPVPVDEAAAEQSKSRSAPTKCSLP